MDQYAALIVLPNIIAFPVIAWVAYKVYTGKRTEYRLAMSLCFTFIALNLLVLLGEKLVSDKGISYSLVLLEYVCESVIIVSLLVFILKYVGRGRLVTPRNVAIYSSPAVLVIVLNATNQWHGLFYTSYTIAERHGFYLFEAEYGPLFLIWMGFFLVTVVTSIVLLLQAMVVAPRGRRGALWLLILAMVITIVFSTLGVLSNRDDPMVDMLSIGLALAAITIFLGDRHSDLSSLEIIRFREAIAGMDDAVIILDSSLRVVYSNPLGARILSENGDFLWERIAARGYKIPAGSNKWETAMALDGAPRHYILSTSDIYRGKVPVGAVLVFHDITNRKMLEEDLRRVNRGMSTLNQIVRHDIRNDLTALWGYLELLQGTELNGRQQELARKMAERARSVDGHLSYARDVRPELMMTTKWHDLRSTIDEAIAGIDLKGVGFDNRLHGIKVLADPMLPSVFHSLADNTVRHGVSAKTIVARGEETATGLSIIWEDDGVGVPSESKEKIFGEGFGHNTGEGLFLSKEILSTTGISIHEEGKPGSGARFVIKVPSGWYTWK